MGALPHLLVNECLSLYFPVSDKGFTYSTGAADGVLKEDSGPSKPAGIEFAS